MKTCEQAYQELIAQQIEEILEFGLPLDVAEKMAPRLVEIFHDPRGARQALIELEPSIALHLGLITKQ